MKPTTILLILILTALLIAPFVYDHMMQVRSNTALIHTLMSAQTPVVVNHFAKGSYMDQVVMQDAVVGVEEIK